MRLFRSQGLHRVTAPARLVLLLYILLLMAFAGRATVGAAEFPQIQAETVSGITMDLPGDFAAGPSVIVIVYDQNQQPEADSWVAFLDDIAVARPAARYYLMPVLPAGLSVVRGMIEGVIRNSAADAQQLDRTIVLFADVEALQRAFGVNGTSAVHILVLGDDGRVVATASGAYSVANAATVEDALANTASEGGNIGKLPGGK